MSFASALKGFKHGLKGRNFLIGASIGAGVITVAYQLPLTTTEQFIILLLIACVLAAELFNSAIEELADVLIQEHHPGIARVKELSAAAVVIFVIIAAVIGGKILFPYLG